MFINGEESGQGILLLLLVLAVVAVVIIPLLPLIEQIFTELIPALAL